MDSLNCSSLPVACHTAPLHPRTIPVNRVVRLMGMDYNAVLWVSTLRLLVTSNTPAPLMTSWLLYIRIRPNHLFFFSIVTDEDFCGRNVLHYHLFQLLRDCSTIALPPTYAVAISLHQIIDHSECVDTERCTVLAHLLEYFGGFIWDLLSLNFLILKSVKLLSG